MTRFAMLALVWVLGAGGIGVAAEPTKSHLEAADTLLKTMEFSKQMDAAVDQMVALQVKTNPKLEPFKDVMRSFLKKHMSYETLKGDLLKLYADNFTESELKDLTAFYKTPLGKKMLEKQPVLMKAASELGARKVQENAAELRMLIEEAAKKKN
jgi:uncharacterized protein